MPRFFTKLKSRVDSLVRSWFAAPDSGRYSTGSRGVQYPGQPRHRWGTGYDRWSLYRCWGCRAA